MSDILDDLRADWDRLFFDALLGEGVRPSEGCVADASLSQWIKGQCVRPADISPEERARRDKIMASVILVGLMQKYVSEGRMPKEDMDAWIKQASAAEPQSKEFDRRSLCVWTIPQREK